VITGGASGFGLALAQRSAALGMDVALVDRDGERAAEGARAVAAMHGVQTLGVMADVASAPSLEAAASAVDERFGPVDMLLSNVGVQLFGSLETFTDDEWRWMLDVNVTGTARTVRSFLPLLRRAPAPKLAVTTSSSVFDPASHLAAYQASKFAVWGLAESLRVELAGDGIGITVVFPSGMISRHLESSELAQPDHLRRPVAREGDLDAVIDSNPNMAAMLATCEDAASGVVEAILRGEPYVITHGDLTEAIATRNTLLSRSAEAARDQSPQMS
jgi:NAD(P)-dependent dehydrogenase (short-subunit alcohol dehydrogenase family)